MKAIKALAVNPDDLTMTVWYTDGTVGVEDSPYAQLAEDTKAVQEATDLRTSQNPLVRAGRAAGEFYNKLPEWLRGGRTGEAPQAGLSYFNKQRRPLPAVARKGKTVTSALAEVPVPGAAEAEQTLLRDAQRGDVPEDLVGVVVPPDLTQVPPEQQPAVVQKAREQVAEKKAGERAKQKKTVAGLAYPALFPVGKPARALRSVLQDQFGFTPQQLVGPTGANLQRRFAPLGALFPYQFLLNTDQLIKAGPTGELQLGGPQQNLAFRDFLAGLIGATQQQRATQFGSFFQNLAKTIGQPVQPSAEQTLQTAGLPGQQVAALTFQQQPELIPAAMSAAFQTQFPGPIGKLISNYLDFLYEQNLYNTAQQGKSVTASDFLHQLLGTQT